MGCCVILLAGFVMFYEAGNAWEMSQEVNIKGILLELVCIDTAISYGSSTSTYFVV